MKLGEKLRYLRLVEGTLRGMDREMTQQDLVRALKKEVGAGLSQSYLSQIESGARPHLTNASRMLLARFFKVHPGYLVDDPEGYHTELTSDLRATEDRLDLWLINGAEQSAHDPELQSCAAAGGQAQGQPQGAGAAGRDSGDAGAGGAADGSVEAGGWRRRRSGRATARSGRSEFMTWAIFYLVCFLVGVTLSVLSFIGGTWHLPHVHLACAARGHAWRTPSPRRQGHAAGHGCRHAVLQLRHHHGVSRVVRRHRLSADALFDAGGHAGAGGFDRRWAW